MADIDEMVKVKRSVEDDLLARPGVTGVAVGYREVGGKRTDEIVIRVYVEAKRPAGDLSSGDLIPAEIQGHRTDVIEAQAPTHTALTDRVRPLPCGVWIIRPPDSAGTIGLFVRYHKPGTSKVEPTIYLLTNHHILYPAGHTILDENVYQAASVAFTSFDVVAVVDKAHRKYGGTVDAALAQLKPGTEYGNYVWKCGWINVPISGGHGRSALTPDRAKVGDLVMKHGWKSKRTFGEVVAVDSTLHFKQTGVTLTDQFEIWQEESQKFGRSDSADFCEEGDSGAVIIQYATKKQPLHATWTRNPIGLLCGIRPTTRDDGSPGPSYAVANQIGNVFDELSLDLCGALLKLDDKGPDRYLKA